MRRVALHDGLAEVEGNHLRRQVLQVQPLDHGVVPVQLVEQGGRRLARALDHCPVFFVGSAAPQAVVSLARAGRVPGLHRVATLQCDRPVARARAAASVVLQRPAHAVGVVFDHLHEQVLAPVEVGRDQGLAVGDQVADAHAGAKRITQRLRDMTLQCHRVGELRRDREQGEDVAVAQRGLQPRAVEPELLDEAGGPGLGGIDPLELGPVRVHQYRGAAGIAQDFAHRLLRRFQFVDGRGVDRAGERDPRPDRLEHDHVAGRELHVARLVTLDQELVHVELGDDARIAPQQHLAHRAVGRRATRRHQRAEQGRLAGQGVDPGPLRRADHEHLDGAKLPECDAQVEIGEQPADLRPQMALEVGGLDAGDAEAADPRQVEHAVAVDRAAKVDIDRTPAADDDLVAGADRVVGRDRHVVQRREAVGGVGEEAGAEGRQHAARGLLDKTLELARPRLGAIGPAVEVARVRIHRGVVAVAHRLACGRPARARLVADLDPRRIGRVGTALGRRCAGLARGRTRRVAGGAEIVVARQRFIGAERQRRPQHECECGETLVRVSSPH